VTLPVAAKRPKARKTGLPRVSVKEGWWSVHPLTLKRVSVVPESYANALERKVEALEKQIAAAKTRSPRGWGNP